MLALWVLARIRFPDRSSPAPAAPLITQLVPRPTFADLSSELRELAPKIQQFLVAIHTLSEAPGVGTSLTGLRVTRDSAITLATSTAPVPDQIAQDAPTRLTLVRDERSGDMLRSTPDDDETPITPGYLIAASMASGQIALQPVFLPSMDREDSVLWMGPLWRVSATASLVPGTFLFNVNGRVIGLAIEWNGAPAIVPSATLSAFVRELAASKTMPPGCIGFEVQPVPTEVQASMHGRFVVSWVDPKAPALDVTQGDVVEAVNDADLVTEEQWTAISRRLGIGGSVSLIVRRGESHLLVRVNAGPCASAPALPRPLGVSWRRVDDGTEVVHVSPGSAGAKAKLQTGDLIHFAGGTSLPTPDVIRKSFDQSTPEQPLLIGVTRGESHLLMVLRK